tara:strand:+ start:1050 stop:1211 length:162 start_codon:yes stop_codon:yes gene_type:complete
MEPDKKMVKEAIDYFFHEGMIDNLTGDKYLYVKVLCDTAAWCMFYQDLRWEDE